MKNTPGARTWFRCAVIACVCLPFVAIAHRAALRAAQGNAVTIVPNGRPVEANPGEKGATYYALEAQTSQFTTWFHDGTRATAERRADGTIETTLEDAGGSEINRFKVGHNLLMYLRPSADPVQAVPDASVHTTFDWLNRQSHRLYEDEVSSGDRLEWRDGFMRQNGARGTDDERSAVREVETQWAKGLSARTVRVRTKQGDRFGARTVHGDVFVTKLMHEGVEVGLANYFTAERIFAWTIPGVTEGLLATEHLQTRYADWPFTPDMVWMNLQTIALYHWKTAINQKGFVARCEPKKPNPVVQFFLPTVSANEVGCDRLHWLDGTVLRYCCDVHDYCYERVGCTSRSWWMVWTSWSCDYCNMSTVGCFAAGGIPGPLTRYPW